ncbi:hypothetical protein [Niabella hibiscisoli]|uniref:hypothetical protein n=1 Tax=Niabella hibiscisoli TaxID=1825928 RepID=UPI001F0E0684|nr:hypothetical protein [Niabella hibiscisoli]MCH5715034.1 hypothetical protein [Niabella hibiscisoli]
MFHFGVQKPALKKIARHPQIPALQIVKEADEFSHPIEFSGGLIKSVAGLGDRSAYGLPDETGVIIMDAGKGLLAQSHLRSKDVIVMMDGKKTRNVKDFLDTYNALKNFNKTILVSIIRNQQPLDINLNTK